MRKVNKIEDINKAISETFLSSVFVFTEHQILFSRNIFCLLHMLGEKGRPPSCFYL